MRRFLDAPGSRKAPVSDSSCEPSYGEPEVDNALGHYVIWADTDCNQLADTAFVFRDESALELRETDYYLFDFDEDTQIDAKMVEDEAAGYVWVYYDATSQPTAIGYDYDQDWVVDRYTAP